MLEVNNNTAVESIKIKELIGKVVKWANDRNLIKGSNDTVQFLKLTEELQEVNSAQNDIELTKEVGEYLVVSIIMMAQLGYKDWINHKAIFPSLDWINLMGNIATDLAKGRCAKNSIIAGMNCIYDYLPENSSPKDALLAAYNNIKDRKGMMVNGVFVKEADL